MPSDPDEASIIDELTDDEPPSPEVRLGPGDDAAVLSDGTVVCVDTMVQGVHWDERSSANDVGWKLVMVNASDLGACGALARWATLALSVPVDISAEWISGFAAGLREALRSIDAVLVGGDTTRTPGPITASLTLGGRLAAAQPLTRSGALAGDDIWVSGTLGDAGAFFHHGISALRASLCRPSPPIRLGPALARHGFASAAMDLSDGLSVDLPRLCRASGVGARVDPSALPTSAALRGMGRDPVELQVGFGDDYSLLFTAPAHHREALEQLSEFVGERLTRVGEITRATDVVLQGRTWAPGWSHFGEAS